MSAVRTDDLPLARIEERMRAEGLPAPAIAAFLRQVRRLQAGESGLLREEELEPVPDLPDAESLPAALHTLGEALLDRAVMIKLNGGLGTSMGMDRPKSLLPIKDGLSFLALSVRQAQAAGLPLVLMNSFATQGPSLRALAALGMAAPGALPLDFLQGKVPKLLRGDLRPVEHADPELCWCPPGHGEIYTALLTSGALDALLAAGRRYAFVSNADNAGAVVDPAILGHFAARGVPLLMEVCDRTVLDRKGGHLARQGDRLVLREAAQCAPEDRDAFQDIARHRYFNTNNIWLDLFALREYLEQSGGFLDLPLIRNHKTVDPRDPGSAPVVQVETAMGAAISVFPGAEAIRVPRARFLPVKTLSDLVRTRSDLTELRPDHRLVPVEGLPPCEVELDPATFRHVDDVDERFSGTAPSLRGCRRLVVQGDARFEPGVVCRGEVRVVGPCVVRAGTVLEG